MHLSLARPEALVFGDLEGQHRNPEHTSRQFVADVTRARKVLGEDSLPVVRLHDLRHSHATILLTNGVPVHVVSRPARPRQPRDHAAGLRSCSVRQRRGCSRHVRP
jgi:integrase